MKGDRTYVVGEDVNHSKPLVVDDRNRPPHHLTLVHFVIIYDTVVVNLML
jgi:hypothetical protein